MFPVDDIESLVRKETMNVFSVIHDFGHLRRTAVGAKWFVKVLGGSSEEQEKAYIAGLLHDIVRPASERECHAKASAYRAKEILLKFNIGPDSLQEIITAILSHRKKHEWTSALHQSVFLADKILEQMGALVAFRRSVWVGECDDYKDIEPEDIILKHFEKRLAMFTPGDFPVRFSSLVEYQYKWSVELTEALRNNEQWASELVGYGYDAGRMKTNFEDTIAKFNPKAPVQEKIHKEALLYIKGRKFSQFEKMVGR